MPSEPGFQRHRFVNGLLHQLETPLGHGVGPLAGLRFAVKDMIDLRGVRTGAGHPQWRDEQAVAGRNAWIVDRLLDAGAICVGTTVCDPLAFSLLGENPFDGTPSNPQVPGHLIGGSSCGSAAACAAGAVDFALGTDTAGSIRVPAHHGACFGLRPGHGLLPVSGVTPLAPSLDVPGWLAADGEVMARVSDLLLPPAPPVQRLIWPEWGFSRVDQGLVAAIRAAAEKAAARAGIPVERHSSPPDWATGLDDVLRAAQAPEVWASFGEWVERRRPDLCPDMARRLSDCRTAPPFSLLPVRAMIQAWFASLPAGAALLWPAAAEPPLHLPISDDQRATARAATLRVTALASVGGLPQAVAPLVPYQSLNLGLSLVGAHGSDTALVNFLARGRAK